MNVEDETPPLHSMTYSEREALKSFARAGESLEELIVFIAHWLRCPMDVSFSGYVAHRAAAETAVDVSAIRRQWPVNGPRMIADGSSEWGSYLK